MHTGSYGLMSADGLVQPNGPGGHEGHALTWPIWSGPVPPLADGFTVRPDTVPDLETALIPGATVVLAVAMSVPADSEDDLAAWYTREHIPMLLEVPGWRRIRRFRLVRGMDGPAPDFLSVHELAGPEVLEDPRYLAAISTPWRDQVVASALRRERRVFGLRNAIGS